MSPRSLGRHGADDVEVLLAANKGEELRPLARVASGGPQSPIPEALQAVTSPARLLLAMQKVDAAREAAQSNVNPQLVLATLTAELAEALWA